MTERNPLMDYDSLLMQMAKDIADIKATIPHLVDRSVCEARWGRIAGAAMLISAATAYIVKVLT